MVSSLRRTVIEAMYNKLNPYRSDDTVSLHLRYLSPLLMCLAWRGHVFTRDNNLMNMHAPTPKSFLLMWILWKFKEILMNVGRRALKAHSYAGRKCWLLFINSVKPLAQLSYLSFPGDSIWISWAKRSVVLWAMIFSFDQGVNGQNQTVYGWKQNLCPSIISLHPHRPHRHFCSFRYCFFSFSSAKPAVSAIICAHVITVTAGTCQWVCSCFYKDELRLFI